MAMVLYSGEDGSEMLNWVQLCMYDLISSYLISEEHWLHCTNKILILADLEPSIILDPSSNLEPSSLLEPNSNLEPSAILGPNSFLEPIYNQINLSRARLISALLQLNQS